MFDRARIREIPSQRRARGVNLAAATFAVAALMLIGAGPAGAVVPEPGGGGGGSWEKWGGVVDNHTDMTMRIAVLTGSARCRVYMWPSSFWPDDRSCAWKRLRPGASSRSLYADADAFRFDWDGQAFAYSPILSITRRVGPRIYMKIRDPQKVLCTRIKGFPPHCVG